MSLQAVEARWIGLGCVDAASLHAAYAGVAAAMGPEDRPVLVWGRAQAHLCLGQSQGMCEVAEEVDVPVVRRPLGGGAVWVDERQYCWALVVPLGRAPHYPSQWFAWALAAALRTFARFGLPAELVGNDIWVRGRKIAGSGAATVGGAAVVASSFLLDFPAERFAAAISAPSDGFRRWLAEALEAGMTTWAREGPPPSPRRLATAFRQALQQVHGWRLRDSVFAPNEQASVEEARAELMEPLDEGRRYTSDGIKINHRTYLTEIRRAGGLLRELAVNGHAVRQETIELS